MYGIAPKATGLEKVVCISLALSSSFLIKSEMNEFLRTWCQHAMCHVSKSEEDYSLTNSFFFNLVAHIADDMQLSGVICNCAMSNNHSKMHVH